MLSGKPTANLHHFLQNLAEKKHLNMQNHTVLCHESRPLGKTAMTPDTLGHALETEEEQRSVQSHCYGPLTPNSALGFLPSLHSHKTPFASIIEPSSNKEPLTNEAISGEI